MKKRKIWRAGNILFIALAVFGFTDNLQLIQHSQFKAIASANKVLSLLFNKKYKDAYILLHLDFHKEMDLKLFKKVGRMAFFEESEGIKQLTFDFYLPVPGQRAIQLFYKFDYNSGEESTLNIVLLGDAKKGYKIVFMDFTCEGPSSSDIKIYGLKKWEIEGEIVIKPDTIIITPEELREKIEFED